MVTYFIPLYVLGFLLLVFGVLVLLGRFRGGKYLKPLLVWATKVPLLERWMKKASEAALEKQNPELASAIKKLERAGALRDPLSAQRAMSKLTAGERKAYLDAAGSPEAPQPSNRAERRRLEKARKSARG